MKKLLNTLYVQTQGIYLRQEGETVVAEKDHSVLTRIPIHTLSGIVCFGNVLCSPYLLGLCSERGVFVSFLSEYGKFLARVEGPESGNVLLRITQVNATQDATKVAEIAQAFIIAKVLNTRSVVNRRMRDHGETDVLKDASTQMTNIVYRLKSTYDIDEIRGLEGEAAQIYFSIFNELILNQRSLFQINSRNRRPPLDPMNALLSFLYTLLAHECAAALRSVGLDAQIGFLHRLRPGRISLALDLMEEFRAIIADRVALSLVNMNQLTHRDFIKTESGAVLLNESGRKTVLEAWQKKKKDEVQHPFLEEKMAIGLLPYAQALLLSRYLRGDIDAYPPFIAR